MFIFVVFYLPRHSNPKLFEQDSMTRRGEQTDVIAVVETFEERCYGLDPPRLLEKTAGRTLSKTRRNNIDDKIQPCRIPLSTLNSSKILPRCSREWQNLLVP